jgi:energy-coupling factor transporter ATP-binding protein EcfA2
LDFAGEHAVLCGPNNSGKTTIVSSLYRLSQLSEVRFLPSYGGNAPEGEPFSSPVMLVDWADARPNVTAQLFHRAADLFRMRLQLVVKPEMPEIKDVFPFWQDSEPASFTFAIAARRDQRVQLESIRDEDMDVFVSGGSTRLFRQATEDTERAAGFSKYLATHRAAYEIFELPGKLLRRVVYFPSQRRPTLGNASQIGGLAAGSGLVSWIESATNPDPREGESARAHHLLQEFQREFAEFAGFRNVALSVRKYEVPLLNNEQPEINVTVDGQLHLLSQLGSGIGEALIVLLVCKLSQGGNPPTDIVLLEEPELHLHPRMQRILLERLDSYGVQLIVTTHSPTVINALARRGARIFRTLFDETRRTIQVRAVAGLSESRALLEAIGATPADLLLADKVPWVEGPSDIPVFKSWLAKTGLLQTQNVAVLSIGGNDAASDNFDPSQLAVTHPRMFAILDSERKDQHLPVDPVKLKIQKKLLTAGIDCHLTERRATENYFTERALQTVSPGLKALGPFDDPALLQQRGQQFSKYKNGLVAQGMDWHDLRSTDIGSFIDKLLRD